MSTSARPARRLSTSTPSAVLRSSVMSRLLRLMTRNAADSPSLCGGHVRDSSPLPVSSTLITSAPRSDSSIAQNGPASTREQSTTRTPSRDSAGGLMVMRYYTSMTRLREALGRCVLVLDGAMGTMLQAAGLTAADFGGPHLEGCNEHLNLTRPDVIRAIHEAYLDAGADLISTNSFGCAPYVLGEYGLSDRAYEITLAAAKLARQAVDARSTTERPR